MRSEDTPVQTRNIFDVVEISAGSWHTLVRRSDGTVWTWGHSWFAEPDAYSYRARQVQGISGIASIATGRMNNIVLSGDGIIWAWGSNSGGQIGDGTSPGWSEEENQWDFNHRRAPVQVLGPGGVGHLSLTEETAFAFVFRDIPRNHWARGAVFFVHERGIMQGTAASIFAPDAKLSREMAVTLLYRLAGEPPIEFTPVFTDVIAGQWFSDAIIWASHHEIVFGVGTNTFAPQDSVTREQFAVMLYRYAVLMGFSVEIPDGFSLADFPTYAQVSPWAYEALRWAVYHQLITGTDAQKTLEPLGIMTRAQCAVVLQRFIQSFA